MDGISFSAATKNLHANFPATLQQFLLFHTVLCSAERGPSVLICCPPLFWLTTSYLVQQHCRQVYHHTVVFSPKNRDMAGVQHKSTHQTCPFTSFLAAHGTLKTDFFI